MTAVVAKKISELEESIRRQEKQIALLVNRVAHLERENTKRKSDINKLE